LFHINEVFRGVYGLTFQIFFCLKQSFSFIVKLRQKLILWLSIIVFSVNIAGEEVHLA